MCQVNTYGITYTYIYWTEILTFIHILEITMLFLLIYWLDYRFLCTFCHTVAIYEIPTNF